MTPGSPNAQFGWFIAATRGHNPTREKKKRRSENGEEEGKEREISGPPFRPPLQVPPPPSWGPQRFLGSGLEEEEGREGRVGPTSHKEPGSGFRVQGHVWQVNDGTSREEATKLCGVCYIKTMWDLFCEDSCLATRSSSGANPARRVATARPLPSTVCTVLAFVLLQTMFDSPNHQLAPQSRGGWDILHEGGED